MKPAYIYNSFADSVLRIMDDPSRDWDGPDRHGNDFCSLAIAGESLRRMCGGYLEEDGPQDHAFQTLEKYDQFLAKFSGILPLRVVVDFESVIQDIVAYAHLDKESRDYDDGVNLLDELEHVMMIAAACWRVRGALEETVVVKMGERASSICSEIVDKIPELAEYAWHRDLAFGADLHFENLYRFWDALAEESRSERALRKAVVDAARQEKLIEKVMAKFNSSLDEDKN